MDFVGLVMILVGAWLLYGVTTNKKTGELTKSALTDPAGIRDSITSAVENTLPTNSEVFPGAYATANLAAATQTAALAALTTSGTTASAGVDSDTDTSSAGSGAAVSGSGNSYGAAAVAFARSQIGKPYVWGAAGPDSYDCSGLVSAAYRAAGHSLGRITTASVLVSSGYITVPQSSLQIGDIVEPYAGHMGIYSGGGKMIEARGTVRETTITSFLIAKRPV